MSVNKKLMSLVMIATLVVGALTGCQSSQGTSEDGVTTIIVGTGTSYNPYCYLDEKGNPAGYEVEVLKVVDELLPQYKIEIVTSDFKGLFTSLVQKKIDVAAHQIEWNEERGEAYLFGEEAYTTFITYITVLDSVEGVDSLEDLAGKKAYVPAGDNAEYILGKYNEEHPETAVNLDIQTGLSKDEVIAGIKSGKWDFMINTKRDVEAYNKDYSAGLKIVGDPVQTSSTYYIFRNGEDELKEAFDGAIKELRESGRLSEISIKVIGGDYTEGE